MFNPDSELKIPIRLDDYKQQRSGGYSTAPFFYTSIDLKGEKGFLHSIGLKWAKMVFYAV